MLYFCFSRRDGKSYFPILFLVLALDLVPNPRQAEYSPRQYRITILPQAIGYDQSLPVFPKSLEILVGGFLPVRPGRAKEPLHPAQDPSGRNTDMDQGTDHRIKEGKETMRQKDQMVFGRRRNFCPLPNSLENHQGRRLNQKIPFQKTETRIRSGAACQGSDGGNRC